MDAVLEQQPIIQVQQAMQLANVESFCIIMDNILSKEECDKCISVAEAQGFVEASLYTDAQGIEHYSSRRKSKRTIIDSQVFANRLWERIKHAIPKEWKGKTLSDSPVNERLRILKYDTPGDEFKMHSDGQYRAPNGSISIFTILIYLNVGYEGAYTHFLSDDDTHWIPITPLVGRVTIQDQHLIHCVPRLEKGCKYAIRTEIMYK
jgi:hypothetical protein